MSRESMAETRSLTSVAELDQLLREAGPRPLWIFKHSLACGVSSSALATYGRFAASRPDGGEIHCRVDVQGARALADEIARITGVRHETPQALLLIAGRVVWHGSHWQITSDALASAASHAGSAGREGVA